jgi:hypothetical protein
MQFPALTVGRRATAERIGDDWGGRKTTPGKETSNRSYFKTLKKEELTSKTLAHSINVLTAPCLSSTDDSFPSMSRSSKVVSILWNMVMTRIICPISEEYSVEGPRRYSMREASMRTFDRYS